VSLYGESPGAFHALAMRASGAAADGVARLSHGEVKEVANTRCVRMPSIGSKCVRSGPDLTVVIVVSGDFSRRQTAEMVGEAWVAVEID